MAEVESENKEGLKPFWLYPRWLENRPALQSRTLLFILAAVVGLLGGLGATLFKELSTLVQQLFLGGSGDPVEGALHLPWYQKLLLPFSGGVLAGLLLYLLPKEAKGHGVSEIMEAVTIRRGILNFRGAIVRSASSLMSIGSGASIGREGPIVQIAAAMASKAGQFFRVSKENQSILVGCGVAAGLAAAYNVPIAASFFVMEIIIGNFAIDIFAPLVISSVASTLVYRKMFGNDPVFGTPHFMMVSNWELIAYILLGVCSGIAAAFLRKALSYSDKQFNRLPGPIEWRLGVGGLLVGAIGILWPQVWGNGFTAINSILKNQMAIGLIAILFFMKLFATSISVGSGASGGVFTPTQFIGAMLGGVIGYVAHHLFPGYVAEPSAYALVGMGCLMAGTTYAPIMAIMMIFETTLNYEIILPLMLSCILSSTIAKQFHRDSIYAEKLRMKGISYDASLEESAMRMVRVSDLMRTDVPVIPASKRFKDVIHEVLKSRSNVIYVVEDTGKLVGSIDIHDLKEFLTEESLYSIVFARDLAMEVNTAMPEQSLVEVMDAMYLTDSDQLPVVENATTRKFLGVITRRDIIGAYSREVLKKKMLMAKFVTREKETEGIDYVEMPTGYRIGKVPLKQELEDQTLRETNFRTKFGLQVLEVLRNSGDGKQVRYIAEPGLKLKKGDALIVIGSEEDMQKYRL
ncbi:ClcB-like voltage-gated chloride channel protein [bacterium]|nr:ClcB-like voltage-gated chloride channel protein [bacterium]MCI0605799.1 ClcB-like voltage-gated chloride channel protein [bacterium]